MPEIRRFMDLSVKHLDGESRDFLEEATDLTAENNENPTPEAWSAVATPTGFFVHAWEAADLPTVRIPHKLGRIMIHARRHGCDYIMFDIDGPDDPELELFEREGE